MKSYLQNLIQVNGAMRISQFMNEALFHPQFGYYTNQNPFGSKGDFITAPEISQVFGELIGAYFVSLWQNNYSEGKINLVEMGAGRGTLMKDFLNFADKIPNFKDQVKVSIIEISPKLQEVQKQNLQGLKIDWYNNFSEFFKENNSAPIFFFSNELFDCFPINQFVKTKDGWAENMVGIDNDGNLQLVVRPILANQIVKNDAKIGDVYEESPSAEAFMTELSEAIEKTKGIAMIIDYGYKTSSVNTLQAVQNHKYSDVLKDVGESDITALVNFSALNNTALEANLQTSFITQRDFLLSLGIEERRVRMLEGKDEKTKESINQSLDRLIDEKQMGELFKVLIIWA